MDRGGELDDVPVVSLRSRNVSRKASLASEVSVGTFQLVEGDGLHGDEPINLEFEDMFQEEPAHLQGGPGLMYVWASGLLGIWVSGSLPGLLR